MDGYLARVAKFRSTLEEIGCTLSPTPTYIISVLIGHDDVAERVRQDLIGRGFLVPVLRYPAVKRNEAVMRLMLYGRHTDAQVDSFLAALAEVKSEYGF